jgi:hypothetical protein
MRHKMICVRLDRSLSRQGDSAMFLFPAMMIGGHLLIAVVDKVPDLNFEPICREGAGEKLAGKDDVGTCIKDESAARDALSKQWSEFESADRARCVRLSTTNRSASYVEVLTCLEMDRDAKKLRQREDAGIGASEPAPLQAREKITPPAPSVRLEGEPVSPPPPPLPLEPRPASATGLLQIFCLPGLRTILPACISSGGRP